MDKDLPQVGAVIVFWGQLVHLLQASSDAQWLAIHLFDLPLGAEDKGGHIEGIDSVALGSAADVLKVAQVLGILEV